MQYDATREALYNPGNASDFFAQGRPKPTAALCAEMSRLSYCKTETTVAQCLNRAGFTDYKLYDKCGSQNIRQRIGRKRPWLAKRNNCIFIHGVSFLLGNRRLGHRQDTPPSHHNVTNFRTYSLSIAAISFVRCHRPRISMWVNCNISIAVKS